MFKILIRNGATSENVRQYVVSTPELAIEQFKQLVGERGDNLQLHLLQETTELFRFDLRPEIQDKFRWQAKTDIITGESILPDWYDTKESLALFPGTSRQVLESKQSKLTLFYNFLKIEDRNYYDARAIRQIINKSDIII